MDQPDKFKYDDKLTREFRKINKDMKNTSELIKEFNKIQNERGKITYFSFNGEGGPEFLDFSDREDPPGTLDQYRKHQLFESDLVENRDLLNDIFGEINSKIELKACYTASLHDYIPSNGKITFIKGIGYSFFDVLNKTDNTDIFGYYGLGSKLDKYPSDFWNKLSWWKTWLFNRPFYNNPELDTGPNTTDIGFGPNFDYSKYVKITGSESYEEL